jgi:hypothetical protein
MLRDVEYFRAKLSKIAGAGDVGDYLVGVVEGTHVEGEHAGKDGASENPTENADGAAAKDGPKEGTSGGAVAVETQAISTTEAK